MLESHDRAFQNGRNREDYLHLIRQQSKIQSTLALLPPPLGQHGSPRNLKRKQQIDVSQQDT